MMQGNESKTRILKRKVDPLKHDWGQAEVAVRLAVRRRTADVVIIDVAPLVEILIKAIGVNKPNARGVVMPAGVRNRRPWIDTKTLRGLRGSTRRIANNYSC